MYHMLEYAQGLRSYNEIPGLVSRVVAFTTMINSVPVSQTKVHFTLITDNRDTLFLFTAFHGALISKYLQ